jgi:hypothetical protein
MMMVEETAYYLTPLKWKKKLAQCERLERERTTL